VPVGTGVEPYPLEGAAAVAEEVGVALMVVEAAEGRVELVEVEALAEVAGTMKVVGASVEAWEAAVEMPAEAVGSAAEEEGGEPLLNKVVASPSSFVD